MSLETNKKSVRNAVIWLTISVLFMLFIFSNSLRSGESSSMQSGFILGIAKNVFGFLLDLGLSLEGLHLFIRKLAHFSEFAVFGVFLMLLKRSAEKIDVKTSIFINLFIGLITGVTDEFIQFFVPGRGSMVIDVVIDFSGFLFGTLILLVLFKLADRKKLEKN